MNSERYIDGKNGPEEAFRVDEETYEVLADSRRAAAIAVLRRDRRSIPTSDLATRVAAVEGDKRLIDVTEREHDEILVSLRHRHLPMLADRRIVDWNRSEGVVGLDDDSRIPTERMLALLETRADGHVDRLFRTLSNGRRRTALAVLAEAGGSLSVRELARRVSAHELGADTGSVSRSEVRRVEVSLFHNHLPSMDAANLLELDEEDSRVQYDGHPLLIPR